MVILTDKFLKKIDKYDAKIKGRFLEAFIKLQEDEKLGRGARQKTVLEGTYFDVLGPKLQLKFFKKDGEYWVTDIWDHDSVKRSQSSSDSKRKFYLDEEPPGHDRGFSKTDFDVLRSSFNIPEKLSEEDYFTQIQKVIYPKFEFIGKGVESRLWEDLGVELHPQLAQSGDIGLDPVVWLAFTRSREDHYETQAQLTLHLAIGDGIREGINRKSYFCIKLAVFHDKPDTRRFWKNIENNREIAVKTIRKYARKLDPLYEIRYYKKKGPPTEILPVRSEKEYFETMVDYLSPDSTKRGIYSLSLMKHYDFHDEQVVENFGDMKWVIEEMTKEFSKLMYLYFWFSEDDPVTRIKDYREKKIKFDNKPASL